MAGIILKNENGTEVEYSDVKQIVVPYKENNGTMFDMKYTLLSGYNVYSITSVPGSSGWKVTGTIPKVSTGDFYMCNFGESDCRDLGRYLESANEYQLNLFFTLKKLEVGQIYELEDMY